MQVVILAGGFGTRLSEETDLIPKPMVMIGNKPILLHIMDYYSSFGHKDFIIALGYKAKVAIDYFSENHQTIKENGWIVDLVDTGLASSTGGRILKLKHLLKERFMLTYGDGLSNVDLKSLQDFHVAKKKIATITAVRPPSRFGTLEISDGRVSRFGEKDPQAVGWVNGGFFCLESEIFDFIKDDITPFEQDPINKLVDLGQLSAFEHHGWWQPMDTLREKHVLEEYWESGSAPWLQKNRKD